MVCGSTEVGRERSCRIVGGRLNEEGLELQLDTSRRRIMEWAKFSLHTYLRLYSLHNDVPLMQVDSPISTKAASLQAQIQSLTDLHNRLKSLRQIPSLVLKPPTSTNADGLPLSPHSQPSLRTEFGHVNEIGNIIRSGPIQEALRSARDSFQVDTKGLNFNLRRKRRYVPESLLWFFSSARGLNNANSYRRSPSPGSPQPYVAVERKSTSLFPLMEDGVEPLRAEGLGKYIRDFNRSSQCKLRLWRKTRGTPPTDQPTVLRFEIPDVLTAYLSVCSRTVICESVTFFAPRERVSNIFILLTV